MRTAGWRPGRGGAGEAGMAMLMALVVIMVLAIVSAGLANLAVSEYSTATTVDRSSQAFLAAEAGAELAIDLLRGDPDADWSDQATSSVSWTTCCANSPRPLANTAFPDPDSPICATSPCPVGTFTVAVRRIAGRDPAANITVRAIGTVRGATRTIEFELRRATGADFMMYSILDVDTTAISGGGSLQFHGSAYIEGNLVLRGAAQAGFFNDRYVSLADAPRFLNHLYIQRNLDTTTGNPTIGNPYHWVHIGGSITGRVSTNFNPTNLDSTVLPPFYPDVVAETQRALTTPGNLLRQSGGTLQFVRCRWQGSGWIAETPSPPNLVLAGTVATDTFFLPPPTVDPANPCGGYPASISQVRAGGQFRLMWDPTDATAQLVFRNDTRPIYVPGGVRIGRDIRYEGRGTIVVGNQPSAVAPGQVTAQSGCALDFNLNSLCGTQTGSHPGYSLRARISPCLGSPGTDNPLSTYARVNASHPNSPDVAVFVVNGSAHANLNANACAQEMNLMAIVGARGSSALFTIVRKLQWYGILMTRGMGLGQVPDFWQMPDMLTHLPAWTREIILQPGNPVQVLNWRELY
ncbi:MAG: hypothetical protein QN174_09090 [Armatimonadota bacterium]|nr:hypothetical protein [Armatimonadota bacterium]MDR7453241.1 hypothetical protein [Armatimonadota bacterium]MDR7455857.1 hypothetical protein [Armatimonadota bacterium]MDR7497098.1 hypothetical protein [Armatimonadota bacterium]MDR7511912.1 hypothetical protein [Armatimonadota bacterium]